MADERKRIIDFDSAEEVYSDAQLAIDSASHGTKKISPTLLLQGLTDAVDGLTDSLSDEYNSAATYAVGDYCIYNNRLYKCTTAISTAEAWNPSHWTPTSCDAELSELKTDLVNSNNVNLLNDATKYINLDTNKYPSAVTNYMDGSSFTKVGSIVFLNLNLKSTSTGTGLSFTGILPSGYKPDRTYSFMVGDGSATGQSMVNILNTGTITIYFGATGYTQGLICFPAFS